MVAEKSILQQVREKELMLNIKIYEARGEAEKIIQNARNQASEMIVNSEREGKKAAEEFYQKETDRIRQEIGQLRNQGDQDAMATRVEGEHNLGPAIEKIVITVSMR